ncbi:MULTISPECIES: helix-turn-helix transcriptional regulator [Pseudonocardia]|uniref:helix-turn-helix transcriptional regulator n=1 Tax=Pseudonocardia TaxID=1847 RepID=UPI001AD652A6|nr:MULTISPECIES: LuxR C-terminal-related transcriptional regulator [Pseudonocardia]MBO4238921.1 hypothetical protein [Pseudonocardia alni]
MSREQIEFCGRDEVLDALRGTPEASLTVLRGPTSSGRTALLTRIGDELRESGSTVLFVDADRDHAGWDRFGVRPLLGAVGRSFEQLDPGPELPGAMRSVRRLATAETYESIAGRSRLRAETGRLLAAVGTRGPVTLAVDDADHVAAPLFVLAEARRAGHRVLAAMRSVQLPTEQVAEVGDAADEIVDLPMLSDEASVEILRRAAGGPVDPGLVDALRDALGLLFGCPGTLIRTLAALREDDRVVRVDRTLCLRDDRAPIGLPAGHFLVGTVRSAGRAAEELVALAAGPTGLRIADLDAVAGATGRTAVGCGALVDALAAESALECDFRGRLTPLCRALGTTVRAGLGEDALRDLHVRIGRRVQSTVGLSSRDDLSALAGHVAAAGTTWPVRQRLTVVLHDEAVRLADSDPDLAISHLRSAWRHAGPGHGRRRVQAELVRATRAAGRFDELADFVADAVDEGGYRTTGSRTELAASAALAALQLGRRVSTPVRSALSGIGDPSCPLQLCERWWRGEHLSIGELVQGFAPLAPGGPVLALRDLSADSLRVPADVRHAFSRRRLVPMLRWLLGPDYRPPADGPFAAFERMMVAYGDGRWNRALSAARALQTQESADVVSRPWAALAAAAVHRFRGRERRAHAWARTIPETDHTDTDTAVPALREWAEARLAHTGENALEALPATWAVYSGELRRGSRGPHAGEVLNWLAMLARSSGDDGWRRRIGEAVEDAVAVEPESVGPEYGELIEAMLHDDPAAARRGVAWWRERGSLPDLAQACLQAADVVGPEEAEPLLHEALAIADDLKATRIRRSVRRAMSRYGIAVRTPELGEQRLSELEMQLVGLITEGRSNRQIAARITMSEKTVENHLTRLFGKTGCRNRRELVVANLAGRLTGLGPEPWEPGAGPR